MEKLEILDIFQVTLEAVLKKTLFNDVTLPLVSLKEAMTKANHYIRLCLHLEYDSFNRAGAYLHKANFS